MNATLFTTYCMEQSPSLTSVTNKRQQTSEVGQVAGKEAYTATVQTMNIISHY